MADFFICEFYELPKTLVRAEDDNTIVEIRIGVHKFKNIINFCDFGSIIFLIN